MKSGLSVTIKQNGLDAFSTAGKSCSIVYCPVATEENFYMVPLFLKFFIITCLWPPLTIGW